ncbi:hypothetical protein [Carboxylicivirga marina]|uniref:CopG family transcriptional regulator n=1 Tax=Carboxylicivirga marina TaxID=2800988 RepID=A0ABS1HPX3_9BACT|nr:hypothetical protein [Carboxylicivirga marina]MBK3519726.1 hypothetical protein [Carboxylicivirga marina]
MSEKTQRINFKHTYEDKEKLDYIAQTGKINNSEAIRKAINYTYQNLKDILEPEQDEVLKAQTPIH